MVLIPSSLIAMKNAMSWCAWAEEIKQDERYRTMLEFSKIHGVGPATARELYDVQGCRTIEDVALIAHTLPSMGEKSTWCASWPNRSDLRILHSK